MVMVLVFGEYFADGLLFAGRGVVEEFGEVFIFLFVEVVLFGWVHENNFIICYFL